VIQIATISNVTKPMNFERLRGRCVKRHVFRRWIFSRLHFQARLCHVCQQPQVRETEIKERETKNLRIIFKKMK